MKRPDPVIGLRRFPLFSRGWGARGVAVEFTVVSAVVLPLVLALVLALPAAATLMPGSAASATEETPSAEETPGIQLWSVSDTLGHGWGLSLFGQPDPDFAPGWRLRLNARTPGLSLDHQRPLVIGDGLGGSWELANCSVELVARGEGTLPAGSAQFDATDLDPRPRDALPLRLTLPLADGTTATVTLGPEVVAALHALP